MHAVHIVKYALRDKGFMKTRFIFIARDLQIKHKLGRFGNSKDNILKWENNGTIMTPFGMKKKKKMSQNINTSSASMRVVIV
jgi:transposase InsO family protein